MSSSLFLLTADDADASDNFAHMHHVMSLSPSVSKATSYSSKEESPYTRMELGATHLKSVY